MTGVSSSCGACKFLRRRCTSECVFAPYFCYEQAATHFAAVHKVFGASNVSKLLLHLPVQSRSDAAITISYEALARMADPVYGCVAHIFALQQQVASLNEEIEIIASQMTSLGPDIASCFVPFMMEDSYFATQSEITSSNQQSQAIHQACCSDMEFQQIGTEDELSQSYYFNSSIFDRLLEELNQDSYLLEELNQNTHLSSPWMVNAAP